MASLSSWKKHALGFQINGIKKRVVESASRAGTTGDWQAQADQLDRMTYDDWLRDKVVYGTSDAVVERLQQLRDQLGLTQLLYEINFGRQIPYNLQLNNLQMLHKHVIPAFKPN